MRVEKFLQDSAQRFPDKVALVTGSKRLSYGDLDTLSDGLAAALSSPAMSPSAWRAWRTASSCSWRIAGRRSSGFSPR